MRLRHPKPKVPLPVNLLLLVILGIGSVLADLRAGAAGCGGLVSTKLVVSVGEQPLTKWRDLSLATYEGCLNGPSTVRTTQSWASMPETSASFFQRSRS